MSTKPASINVQSADTKKYVAQKFVAPSPETEILGQGLLALLQNIRADETAYLLERHGLKNLQPNEWYPFQKSLDMYEDLLKAPNALQNLASFSMKLIDLFPFPPEIASILAALEALIVMNKSG